MSQNQYTNDLLKHKAELKQLIRKLYRVIRVKNDEIDNLKNQLTLKQNEIERLHLRLERRSNSSVMKKAI